MKTLKEYAKAHGATEEAFINAGWKETTHNGSRALLIPTNGGDRWRMLGGDPKSRYRGSSKQAWYKLEEAIEIAYKANHPLVLTNGEASVVAAQYHGIPATAVTMGEKSEIPPHVMQELKEKYKSSYIFLAYDSDKAGYNATKGQYEQLTKAGYSVIALNFEKDNGYDLADWLREGNDPTKLQQCRFYDFTPAQEIITEKKSALTYDNTRLYEDLNEHFPWNDFVENNFGEVEDVGKGRDSRKS